ncbi:RNA polymerase sigma factor [Kitasatospora sp. NPDC097643]|uniref:RNA polymerase sigma factor n=1 Tax=Kitasatospora sp. NPDC097643 TaxID=3157230 RepID=UPI0033275A5D
MAECNGRCAESGGRQSADFNRAFTALLPRLHRAAAALTGGSGSPLAAGDVLHDAYLRIARRPERFLGHPQPYAYVCTTMANILRDQWRRERRRVLLAESAGRERAAAADPLGGGLVELQARWEVARLLGCLTAKQARAVALVDLDGYTVDEAAALLGLHRSTLAVTRRRAHGRLRAALERERERGHERDHTHVREHGHGRERGRASDGKRACERGRDPGGRDRGCRARPDAPN